LVYCFVPLCCSRLARFGSFSKRSSVHSFRVYVKFFTTLYWPLAFTPSLAQLYFALCHLSIIYRLHIGITNKKRKKKRKEKEKRSSLNLTIFFCKLSKNVKNLHIPHCLFSLNLHTHVNCMFMANSWLAFHPNTMKSNYLHTFVFVVIACG